jgi:hypothetical protein
MSWNYRVIRKKHFCKLKGLEHTSYTYEIHEVYYDKKGGVWAFTVDPIAHFGETILDCEKSYKMQAEAFKAPILDYDVIKKQSEKAQKKDNTKFSKYLKKSKSKRHLKEEKDFDAVIAAFDSQAFYQEQEAIRIKDEEKYNKRLMKKGIK